ncbi:MAG: efflux RND transporter periplasmic adaptor subunit [Xanthomonadales bacterium]|nr:efflux RND transporter periplasmic adaptor subunit [Xanthomonadales bacterium]
MSRRLAGNRPATPRRRWRWPLLALATLVVLVVVWRWSAGGDSPAYRTATVDQGPVRVAIAATGRLSALSTVEVGSQVSGQVLTVEVDFNDPVQAGQAIAHIDPANFQSRLNQVQAELTSAQANLESARANLGEAQATLRHAAANFQRAESIWQQRLISRADYDATVAAHEQAQARVASATAAIRVAQSQVEQRRAGLETARLDLDYTVIRSPVDGVVLLRSVEPGQTVASSFQTPVLFSIAEDLGKMQIELTVDESDVGQIREGQEVVFTVDAFPGREFAGDVRQVRLAAGEASTVVTYPVIVDVDNRSGELLPGMTANAEVLVSERTDVVRLANAALRYRPADAAVPVSGNGPPDAAAIARMRAQGERQINELADRLGLDPGQRERLAQTMADMRRQMMSQAQAGGGQAMSEQARRRRSADAMAAALQPLRAELDASQQARLDEELALMASTRQAQVWVLRDGRPQPVSVRIGLADASWSEVRSGLQPGDEVIIGVERG